jgi:PadR family transcriptional regulator, regulatory protein PadR
MRGRGRGHGWRRRGASRRAVRFVEPTLLLLLHYGPAHGYTLIEQLSEYGLGDIDPSAVYRALREMEGQGWVISSWDEELTQGPPRRVYRLTTLGNEALGWWTQDLGDTRQMIDHLLGAYSRHMEEGQGEHH